VGTASEANAESIFGQLHVLSTTVTSLTMSKNMAWPNVTIPHFDLRAREAEDLSGLELIVFSPVVTQEEKAGWEQYAWEHQDWIAEDLLYHGNDSLHPGSISPEIYPYYEEGGGGGVGTTDDHEQSPEGRRELLTAYNQSFHVPVWQLGPVPSNASIINLDLYSHPVFERTINDVLEIEHKLLSQTFNTEFLLEHSDVHDYDDGHPRSMVLQPIFDTFKTSAARVVGFLVGEVAWEKFFVDELPEGINGVLVDVKGTCGDEFTYIINGHSAMLFGMGDLHDPKYDYLKQVFEFAEFARYDGEADDDLRGIHCEYTLAIYPTSVFEEKYHTNVPAIYTSVVVLVFFFTALVFAMYDYMVYRRQAKLLRTAERTTAIVSSLFPKDVQKRIMEDAERQAQEEEQNKKSKGFTAKNQLRGFLANDEEKENAAGDSIFKTKPIADLFPVRINLRKCNGDVS